MKINGFSSPTQAGQAGQSRNDTRASDAKSAGQAPAPAAVTHLHGASGDSSRDIDVSRVAEMREAIAEGRLEFRADQIADKLIDSVRDLLGQGK